MANLPSWGVVATVDEPAALICAFVAHHLAMGAAEVRLYLDSDRPDVTAALEGRPRVNVVVCDAANWATRRPEGRPSLVTGRQRFNGNEALRDTACDWLLHCDADEFLLSDLPVGDALAALPHTAAFATVAVAERQWLRERPPVTIFDGVLRRATAGDRSRIRGLNQTEARMINGHGLLGHFAGKSFMRRGTAQRVGIHMPEPAGRKLSAEETEAWRSAHGVAFPGVLAHFDGLTPLHWALKLLRKLVVVAEAHPGLDLEDDAILEVAPQANRRKDQIRYVRALRRDRAGLQRAIEALMSLPTAEAEALRAQGIILPAMPDLAEQTMRDFPTVAEELSVDKFDQALRTQFASLIAKTGLHW